MPINPEDIEKICANCQLFHPDTSKSGQEAGQSAVIVTRQTPDSTPKIVYGKMGCFNDAYGAISTFNCTEPTQFKPREIINSSSQT